MIDEILSNFDFSSKNTRKIFGGKVWSQIHAREVRSKARVRDLKSPYHTLDLFPFKSSDFALFPTELFI